MYYISLYNTLMKVFFISSTALIIFLMRYKKPFCAVSIHSNAHFSLDLRLSGGRVPAFKSTSACSPCVDLHRVIWMGTLGVHVELLTLAWIACIHPTNHYAQQNQDCGEHHKPLRRCPWSLPILLHSQLGLQVEDGRILLLDPNSKWHVANWPLCRFPVLVLRSQKRGQKYDWITYLKIKTLKY